MKLVQLFQIELLVLDIPHCGVELCKFQLRSQGFSRSHV